MRHHLLRLSHNGGRQGACADGDAPPGKNSQIFRAVVRAVTVDVVNHLVSAKLTAEHFGGNLSVNGGCCALCFTALHPAVGVALTVQLAQMRSLVPLAVTGDIADFDVLPSQPAVAAMSGAQVFLRKP